MFAGRLENPLGRHGHFDLFPVQNPFNRQNSNLRKLGRIDPDIMIQVRRIIAGLLRLPFHRLRHMLLKGHVSIPPDISRFLRIKDFYFFKATALSTQYLVIDTRAFVFLERN